MSNYVVMNGMDDGESDISLYYTYATPSACIRRRSTTHKSTHESVSCSVPSDWKVLKLNEAAFRIVGPLYKPAIPANTLATFKAKICISESQISTSSSQR